MKKIFALLFLFHLLIFPPMFGQKSIELVEGSTQKIEQLIGDWDKEREIPTQNRTFERFQLPSTDLGVPFQHKEKTYICFGDVWIDNGDPLGYSVDTIAEDGVIIDFVSDSDGSYKKLSIPGVNLGGFEVPMEGVSWNDIMYLYCTTDVMTKSILAKSTDDGNTFEKLYDVSQSKFINLNLVKVKADENYPVPDDTEIQVMFGSGEYRKSSVFLAFQRGDQIEQKSMYFFSGFDNFGDPTWSPYETAALPLFDQPCVGELSVSHNKFIEQWILTYNCDDPRGINCRVADNPWGPWSEPFIIFRPWEDNGYCHYIHTNWEYDNCDSVHDEGREYAWGGEYGPYQFDQLAIGTNGETTIYYTLSTWNPYTVVLMKSSLRDLNIGTRNVEMSRSEKLHVYPNPCIDYIIVSFNCEESKSASIALKTITGKMVKISEKKLVKGRNQHRIITSDMSPGVYFLHIESDNSELGYSTIIVVTDK